MMNTNQRMEELKARGMNCKNNHAKFVPLDKEWFTSVTTDGQPTNLYGAYEKAVESLQNILYNYRSTGKENRDGNMVDITDERLKSLYRAVIAYLVSDSDKLESMVNAFGDGKALAGVNEYKQKKDAVSREREREIRKKIRTVEQSAIDATRKTEQIEQLTSDLVGAQEQATYLEEKSHQAGLKKFRTELENNVAYQLCGAEWFARFATKEERTSTNKWVRKVKKALSVGLSDDIIKVFKQNVDIEGLDKAIKEKEEQNIATAMEEIAKREKEKTRKPRQKKANAGQETENK